MKTYVEEHRTSDTAFDIVWGDRTPGEDREKSAAIVRQWEEAGANWWLEAMWESDVTIEDVRRRIEQGPPRDGKDIRKPACAGGWSGNVLFSQGVAPQVSSGLKGLTAVFGMGTGVSPSL